MSAGRAAWGWLPALRRFLVAAGVGNLLWEFAQLPLYTLWRASSWSAIIFATVHCSAGDLGIAAATLVLALALVGAPAWPVARFWPVLTATTVLGAGFTMYSEYLNTVVRRAWAYGPWMPLLPGTGIGISPILQWLTVPAAALLWSRRADPGRTGV